MFSFIFGMPRNNPFSQRSHLTVTHAIRSELVIKTEEIQHFHLLQSKSAAYHLTRTLEKTIHVLFHTFHSLPVHIQSQLKAMNLFLSMFTSLMPALLTDSCSVYDPARQRCSTALHNTDYNLQPENFETSFTDIFAFPFFLCH